jgi:hypothetical protein
MTTVERPEHRACRSNTRGEVVGTFDASLRRGVSPGLLHETESHPDYEYATQLEDVPPDGDGWVANMYLGTGSGGWQDFADGDTEFYFMRRKPLGP